MQTLLFGDMFCESRMRSKDGSLDWQKKRFETEDQYAAARINIDKYCTYNAAVGEQEKGIIKNKHTLTNNVQFCSNL